MKRFGWQIALGASLLLASVAWYLIHFAVFKDAHHIFIYLVGDVAFLPIEVLLVTLIIHGLLEKREKTAKMEKLNMVIGAFFSEVGTRLLSHFSDLDPELDHIRESLIVTGAWSDRDFASVAQRLGAYDYTVEVEKVDIAHLRGFLLERRSFLLRLLENPNLLEHESFTDLLWAAFHLTEELASREDVAQLPGTDVKHLGGDIERVYRALVREWIDYMQHLKANYPYLFSLSMRTNPFDQTASVIVT